MLCEFANGIVLYSHNQLYGQWVVHGLAELLLPKQVRLIIRTSQHQAVLYSATDFAWLTAGQEHTHPYIAKLGPQVLDACVTARDIGQRIGHHAKWVATTRRRGFMLLIANARLAGSAPSRLFGCNGVGAVCFTALTAKFRH